MTNQQDIIKPIDISPIEAVLDEKGHVSGWKLVVTFDNQNINPPHAKGARVSVEKVKNVLRAKYEFGESVMGRGFERAFLFGDAVLKQIARQNMER